MTPPGGWLRRVECTFARSSPRRRRSARAPERWRAGRPAGAQVGGGLSSSRPAGLPRELAAGGLQRRLLNAVAFARVVRLHQAAPGRELQRHRAWTVIHDKVRRCALFCTRTSGAGLLRSAAGRGGALHAVRRGGHQGFEGAQGLSRWPGKRRGGQRQEPDRRALVGMGFRWWRCAEPGTSLTTVKAASDCGCQRLPGMRSPWYSPLRRRTPRRPEEVTGGPPHSPLLPISSSTHRHCNRWHPAAPPPLGLPGAPWRRPGALRLRGLGRRLDATSTLA